jgi:hypothetical protein
MRIVFVGNFGSKGKYGVMHAIEWKLYNGLVRNGHSVTIFSDREVARNSNIFKSAKLGKQKTSDQLIELCRQVAPNALIIGHADNILRYAIEQIKADFPALKTLQWNVDPINTELNLNRIKYRQDLMDITLITTAGKHLEDLHMSGKITGFFPNPADASIENLKQFEVPAHKAINDVCYFTSNMKVKRNLNGIEHNLTEIYQKLHHQDLRVKFYAKNKTKVADTNIAPPVFGGKYQAELAKATMGLNISRINDHKHYSSDRMAQIMANGLLCATPTSSEFADFFDDSMMVYFSSLAELSDKFSYYAKHDNLRQQIAQQGYEQYYKLFDHKIVAKYFIDLLEEKTTNLAVVWEKPHI